MSAKHIDARGLSCPQPVVLTDQAIAAGNTNLEILVDNEVARENVMRLATKRGFKAETRPEGEDILIMAAKS